MYRIYYNDKLNSFQAEAAPASTFWGEKANGGRKNIFMGQKWNKKKKTSAKCTKNC